MKTLTSSVLVDFLADLLELFNQRLMARGVLCDGLASEWDFQESCSIGVNGVVTSVIHTGPELEHAGVNSDVMVAEC